MSQDVLRAMTVLVVGGEPPGADHVRTALAEQGATQVTCVADAEQALLAISTRRPDAVLVLDASPARIEDRLDPLALGLGPPVLVARGSDDATVVAGRVASQVELAGLRVRVQALEGALASLTVDARREREAAEHAAFARLALVADFRDDNTHEHTERVAHLAALLARRLGLAPRTVALIRSAAPLHDVGKVAIPDSILLKPDRLSDEEFEVVKTHAAVGSRILAAGGSELVQTAECIARTHHERWDGTGYPDGLGGESIPLPGRLVAVADVFDVLVHERPYKEEWTPQEAAEEIRRGSATQFDPAVVEAFDALGARAWTSSPQGSLAEVSDKRHVP